MLQNGYGDIEHRNFLGKTPKEATHQAKIRPSTKEVLKQFDPKGDKPLEPDYIFRANLNRVFVLEDQLQALCLDYKIYRYSQKPEEECVVLVYFSDDVLNEEAENSRFRVQLQDKYQSLEFSAAGKAQFIRFNAREINQLMLQIFKKEFNIKTLEDAGVIKEHFMLHTSRRAAILESWNKHGVTLI